MFKKSLSCGIPSMLRRLPEFYAHSFIHFVGFDHSDHEQPWLCNSKGHQRIMLLLFFSTKPHSFWLISLVENLQFGAECVLNALNVQYVRICTWVIHPDFFSRDCLSFQIRLRVQSYQCTCGRFWKHTRLGSPPVTGDKVPGGFAIDSFYILCHFHIIL